MTKQGNDTTEALRAPLQNASSQNKSASNENNQSNVRYVFHLQDHESLDKMDKIDQDTMSTSVYSTYKQRIDSMFDESRSQSSYYDSKGGYTYDTCLLISERHIKISQEEQMKRTINTVQAKIEKMFTEIASTQEKKQNWKEMARVACLHENLLTDNSFSVEHLGSVQLLNKVTSLQELQEPLKNLYFDYCRKVESQHGTRWGKGTLEIASNGLKIHHCALSQDEVVKLNPFNTIAVWAAVKFVCRKKQINNEGIGSKMEYAFSPLIADPEAVDRDNIYQGLSHSEEKMILSALDKNGYRSSPLHHQSPMFIVVMRKNGVPRQLECHGFICACSEDAIVIAANLYQVLIKSVQNKSPVSNIKNCKCKSFNSCCESEDLHKKKMIISGKNNSYETGILHYVAKNKTCEPVENVSELQAQPNSMVSHRRELTNIDNEITKQTSSEMPIRPPRQNKKLSALTTNSRKDLPIRKLPNDIDKIETIDNKNENINEYTVNTNTSIGLQPSTDCLDDAFLYDTGNHKITTHKNGSEYGDVLTKVAIPHSKSFLNANGPFTRYFRQQNSGENFSICNRGAEVSPLGLNELFTELRMQEGLHSMDDILDAIIDAEGMSFNDLKPLYKEFLFKLAVTLTKDELYQRSKFIMRRQKKKRKRRKTCCKNNKFSSGSDGLRRVFRHSFSRFRSSKSKLTNLEFTSVLFPSESMQTNRINHLFRKPGSSQCSLRESQISSTRSSRKKNRRKYFLAKDILNSDMTDSDSFHMAPRKSKSGKSYMKLSDKSHSNVDGINRSSSGYMSCSDCTYDSESCTCSSAEKCYCSRDQEEEYETQSSSDNKMSHSECACDTDSCFESDKCYCSSSKNRHAVNSHSNTRKTSNISTPSKLQKNSILNDSFKESASEEYKLPTTNGLCKMRFPAKGYVQDNVVGNECKNLHTNFSETKESHGKIKCYKCLRHSCKSCQDNSISSFGICCQCEGSTTKLQNRMNVYSCLQNSRRNFILSKGQQVGFNGSCKNSATNYELLENTDTERAFTSSLANKYQPTQQKVLVVSARDQMGRVIYMGATSRNEDSTNGNGFTTPQKNDSSTSVMCDNVRNPSSACEALSVKKSAEIAALFSDVKPSWATDKFTDSSTNKPKENKVMSKPEVMPSGISYYLGGDLENSLGYFP